MVEIAISDHSSEAVVTKGGAGIISAVVMSGRDEVGCDFFDYLVKL